MITMKSKTIFGMQGTPVACSDKKCPFHGHLSVKKRMFVGTVVANKAQKTATITWDRRYYLPKYERYEMRRTKIHAHLPTCIPAREGDSVKIIETRPISKTKNFVVIQNLGAENKIRGEDVTAVAAQEKKAKESKEKAAKQKRDE